MGDSRAFPPGPRGKLIFGHFMAYARDPLGFLSSCSRDFGDVVALRLPATKIFLLSDPHHIDKVLSSKNGDFTIHGGMKMRITQRVFGKGLLTSEGDDWQRQRRLTFPLFSHSLIAKYAEIMLEETEKMLPTWKHGDVRNIHEEMVELTIKIMIRVLLGGSADSPHIKKLAESIATIKDAFFISNRSQGLGRIFTLPLKPRFKSALKKIDGLTDSIIQERRASGLQADDLLSVLMAAQDEEGNPITDEQLRGELKTFLITGHGGPSIMLAWAVYLLSQHPETEAKLLAEIGEVLGDRSPEASDLKQLKYASLVGKETLRLYPPTWFVAREATHACEIGDYHVPRGTQLLMSQWVLHRDERFWEDPDGFRPERWEANAGKKDPKYAYFPYGGGQRFCIGYAYSEMLFALVLTTIMRKFHFETSPDQKIEPYPTAALYPRDGIEVTLVERSMASRTMAAG